MKRPGSGEIINGAVDQRVPVLARRIEAAAARELARAIEAIEEEKEKTRAALVKRLSVLPMMWRKYVSAEHGRMGGFESQEANSWLVKLTDNAAGRLPLSASDWDIREAAKEAARAAVELAKMDIRAGSTNEQVRSLLDDHCRAWGIEPAKQADIPGMLRMLDERWYLRRLRRAHGRRAEGAAIVGGVVRRGLWPYASKDAVMRREDQRKRNKRAMDSAYAEAADGERVSMADIVAGSLANPENKRAELMVRIKGSDGYALLNGWACEFWTVTAPSRFHRQRLAPEAGAGQGSLLAEENPNYKGALPPEVQAYLCKVFSRSRAAWQRRGLVIAGLRTVEPHHDGCPHWHMIVYGPAHDLRYARRLMRVYAMADSGSEPGAKKHRFNYKVAETGTGAAHYAAAYVSKNIDGGGMDGQRDNETGGYISSTVKSVDAWAAHWGIRQFQFFGMPKVGIWRTLRRVDCGGASSSAEFLKEGQREIRRVAVNSAPAGSFLERARVAADASDWCGFWDACVRGGLALLKDTARRLTEYGDAAAVRISGVCEGGRRLMLKARNWVIYWGGKAKKADGVAFDLPRSCVINCTGDDRKEREEQERRRKVFAIEKDFADMAAALFDDQGEAVAA